MLNLHSYFVRKKCRFLTFLFKKISFPVFGIFRNIFFLKKTNNKDVRCSNLHNGLLSIRIPLIENSVRILSVKIFNSKRNLSLKYWLTMNPTFLATDVYGQKKKSKIDKKSLTSQ